ncbi:NAD(P)-dependent oxidoreductase [Pseudomonadota bacterium]
MSYDVICLRPESDFLNVGVTPPADLSVGYFEPNSTELVGQLKSAKVLVIPAVGPKLGPELFDESSVRFVQVTGAGVDRVDELAMKERGIAVSNVVGGSNNAIAEYVISNVLLLKRRFASANVEIRQGKYVQVRTQLVSANLQGLEGLCVGVIGVGNIGLAVAQAFFFMGSDILYHDPSPIDVEALREIDAFSSSLEELLAAADIVTLHVPLLGSTIGLMGETELAIMKRDAILVNAARGGIVDEKALAAAITSGQLGGAVVDVFSREPPDETNPLLSLDSEAAERVLLTPHIAGITKQAWANLFCAAWDNVESVLVRGEPPKYRVY